MLHYQPDDALAEVQEFLAATQSYGTLYKSTTSAYTDRKVAEAGWVLEASVNYLKNVNLPKPSVREITRTIEVQNYTDASGELLISGTDLTAKFDAFITDINTEENTDGSTAKLADARITSVTPTKTILEIKVDMGKGESGQEVQGGGCSTGLTIASALNEMETKINQNAITEFCPSNNPLDLPNGVSFYCDWYYNIGKIFVDGLHGYFTFPNYMSGCSTYNPEANYLPIIDGLDNDCFFREADWLNYTNEDAKIDDYVVLILPSIQWELDDICSSFSCYRNEIYTNCSRWGSYTLLSVDLTRKGFDPADMAIAVDEITCAGSSIAY